MSIVNLETAKNLKKLGFNRRTEFLYLQCLKTKPENYWEITYPGDFTFYITYKLISFLDRETALNILDENLIRGDFSGLIWLDLIGGGNEEVSQRLPKNWNIDPTYSLMEFHEWDLMKEDPTLVRHLYVPLSLRENTEKVHNTKRDVLEYLLNRIDQSSYDNIEIREVIEACRLDKEEVDSYDDDDILVSRGNQHYIDNINLIYVPELYSAPDYEEVLDWLDKEKGVHISISYKNGKYKALIQEYSSLISEAEEFSDCLQKLVEISIDFLTVYSDDDRGSL